MPRFAGEEKTVQALWWSKRETATIRRFGYGDRQAINAKYIRVETDEFGAYRYVFDPAVSLERLNLVLLERGIARWTDEAGDELPVTAEAIAALEDRDAEFLLREIGALNPRGGRSAAEQELFRDERGGGGAGGERTADGVAGRDDLPVDGVELAGADGDAG